MLNKYWGKDFGYTSAISNFVNICQTKAIEVNQLQCFHLVGFETEAGGNRLRQQMNSAYEMMHSLVTLDIKEDWAETTICCNHH